MKITMEHFGVADTKIIITESRVTVFCEYGETENEWYYSMKLADELPLIKISMQQFSDIIKQVKGERSI